MRAMSRLPCPRSRLPCTRSHLPCPSFYLPEYTSHSDWLGLHHNNFIYIVILNYILSSEQQNRPSQQGNAPRPLAYMISLSEATTSQIKCCPGPRRPQFLYQSTHRHPFITRRLFPECHTSIYMVKHQISTRVDRHGRPPLPPLAVHPSMHLSDPGGVRNSVSQRWRPV